jgi:hypothetical protein
MHNGVHASGVAEKAAQEKDPKRELAEVVK